MYPSVSTQIFMREKLGGKIAAAVRAAGFDAVEIYGIKPHFDCADEKGAEEIAAAFRDEGVFFSAIHAPFYDNSATASGESRWLSIASLNEKLRRKSLDRVAESIRAAEIIGAKNVVVHFGADADKNTPDTISNLFSSLVSIEETARGTGVRVAYENIATTISLSGYIAGFILKYEFRNAGICLDIGHANINEEPASSVERCGRALVNLHVSDNTGRSDMHELPFLGGIDWAAVAKALIKVEYDGPFTLETRFAGDPYILLKYMVNAYHAVVRAGVEEVEV